MLKQILFGGESNLSPVANAGLALLRIFTGIALRGGARFGKNAAVRAVYRQRIESGISRADCFRVGSSAFGISRRRFSRARTFHEDCGFFHHLRDADRRFRGANLYEPFAKKELGFFYLFIALCFMLKGAGDWSVDAFFRKKN